NECQSDASPMDGPLLLFIGVGILLFCVVSPLFSIAISGWRAVYEYILWFFVVVRLARTRRAVRLCYVIFVLMGAALGLHAIFQYIAGVPIPAHWVSIYEAGLRTRAFSIVGSPNILGCLMVMLAPMAAGLSYTMTGLRRRALCWAGVVVMCLGCVFTFSRGAWVGLLVAVLVFSLLRDRRLLILGALAAVVALSIPQIWNRFSFIFTSAFERNNTSGGRSERWAYGLDLLERTNPVFGFGLGRFGGAVAMQNQTGSIRYFYLDNYYLKILVEMGYVGLVSYLFLLLSMLCNMLRALFRVRADNERYSLISGIFAGLVGVLVHCYFENIFEVPYMSAYFWGLCALVMVMGWKLREAALQKA
ncbi:MAG: O-antigen ligase family protein, partial [Oscillospiraceae bacterium]|nr:O-antigen ligase family protein [Oscillospiraceae bacterium]